ncbi:hypothetical protein MCOR25_004429 [Pyricularia grisea]|nr:hypothetical protein MCOR25_004429 [Pyricularia grisea]
MEPRVVPDRGGTGPVPKLQIIEPSKPRAIVEESRNGSSAVAQVPTPAILDSWFAKETTETNATANKATEATLTDNNEVTATGIKFQGSNVSHLADAASAAPKTPANKPEPTSKSLSNGLPDSSKNQPSASPPVHDGGTEQSHKATAIVRRPSLAVSPAANHAAIDPLSQHIFMRTNTERNLTSKLRNNASKPDASPASDGQRLGGDVDTPDKKRPRPSFLSRLGMRANRLRNDDDDSGSDVGSQRPDGNNARVFASPVDAQGYIPHHKEPPRYIRTKVYNKKEREFNRMFLAQELVGTRPLAQAKTDEKVPVVTVSSADGTSRRAERTGGAVWATEFSHDGRYLAAAGKDQVVRVWAVISTIEERRTREDEEEALHQQTSPTNGGGGSRERLQAPVFREQPLREFQGHTGEILDLSWSKNNFLLSTSMDRTVRLWHVSRKECLCAFRHGEFVSKVAFHPQDDRFFLAGCLDSRLRLWSIPDRAVAFEAQTSDMITAVAFTPDGKTAIAGMLNGVCNFYETEGLKFQSLLHVRSSRGKNAKGSKITGIRTAEVPAGRGSSDSKVKVLVTSTDARVRIYNLGDKALDVKFKGHEHTAAQLSASFSNGANYVICPSEHRKVFIWSLGSPNQRALNISNPGGIGTDTLKGDKGPCESFVAHGSGVTTAIFAPAETRQLLGASGDPIYDLCNPPPVTLVSREEEEAAAAATSSSRDPSPTSPARMAHNMSQTALSEAPSGARSRRAADESPAYAARSTHQQGNIIVTTDDTGIIKVFRQDCAYRRREGPETASLLSRKRDSIVGRSASILTRTSASSAPHSRKGSLSRSIQGIMTGNGVPHSGGAISEQILDWRRDVEAEGSNGRTNSINSAAGTPVRVERSVSPTKSPLTARTLASERRREQYAHSGSPLVPRGDRGHLSPASSTFSNPHRIKSDVAVAADTVANARPKDSAQEGVSQKPLDQSSCSSKPGETTADAQKKPSTEDETLGGSEGVTPAPSSPSGEGGANNGGLWGFRWPKMPTLRMSIGGIGMGSGTSSPGKDGVVPGANDGQSFVPGGFPNFRASSELSIKEKIKEASKMSKEKGKDKERERKASSRKDERGSEGALCSEEDMACPRCGAREFKAKKLGPGQQQQRQRLICATCATPAAEQESFPF